MSSSREPSSHKQFCECGKRLAYSRFTSYAKCATCRKAAKRKANVWVDHRPAQEERICVHCREPFMANKLAVGYSAFCRQTPACRAKAATRRDSVLSHTDHRASGFTPNWEPPQTADLRNGKAIHWGYKDIASVKNRHGGTIASAPIRIIPTDEKGE